MSRTSDHWGCIIPFIYADITFAAEFNGVWFWIILIGVPSTIGLIFYLYNSIKNYLQKNRFNNKRCEHGVKGGDTLNKCFKCQLRKKELLEASVKLEAENLRKSKILKDADLLKKSEAIRVTNWYYSNIDNAYNLTPYQFEVFVSELFHNLGYSIELTAFSNDCGRDIILYKENQKHLVECKKYSKNNKVGRPELQKFFAAIIDDKATGGYFVTTSDFTKSAIDFANRNKIQLIYGDILIEMIKQSKGSSEIESIKVMCLDYGSIVFFDPTESPGVICCSKNHSVNYPGIAAYINKPVVIHRRKSYHNRYYRKFYRR